MLLSTLSSQVSLVLAQVFFGGVVSVAEILLESGVITLLLLELLCSASFNLSDDILVDFYQSIWKLLFQSGNNQVWLKVIQTSANKSLMILVARHIQTEHARLLSFARCKCFQNIVHSLQNNSLQHSHTVRQDWQRQHQHTHTHTRTATTNDAHTYRKGEQVAATSMRNER